MKRQLPDHQARITALTDIRRSLLVEAGAGSGKTSIIAGRVAVLLASGVHPKNIAAITFTEFAVSELHRRIEFFVDALCRGQIPEDIKIAFPEVSPEQRSNLERARDGLDQLVCTTIHGFAQVLIKPYPAEAEIDPGAEIVDPAEADLAFNERYNAWLRKHLSGAAEDDIVSQVVMADEDGGLALIRSVADFLRRNRDAAPFPCIWSLKAAKTFGAAASKFKKEMGRFKFREQKTEDACKAFVEMAGRLSLLEARMGKQGKREFVQVLRLMEAFKIEEVTAAVRDAIARGAIGFDAVKHLTLCRIERRPPRLDMTIYPYLPKAVVATTSAKAYMGLLTGAAS